jgi:translocation and assembly module TamB
MNLPPVDPQSDAKSDAKSATAGPPPRRRWRYRRHAAFTLAFAAVGMAGLLIYLRSAQFAGVVRHRLVSQLAQATGGKVEVQSIGWSLLHLSVVVNNLTIHGLEAPGEIPYAHVDRLFLRLSIFSFFRPKVILHDLEADRPVFHLIVYPDGSTNQPRPQHPQSNSSIDTIFDLHARRAEVNHGLVVINERSIPFNLRANDLNAALHYSSVSQSYLASAQLDDLNLQRDSAPPLHSRLELDLELARYAATLRALHFSSGASKLDASGSVSSYADPQWNLAARGSVDLRQVSALTGFDGLRGIATIAMASHGSGTDSYAVSGNLRVSDAAFVTSYLDVEKANATAQVSVTPDEIAVTGVNARLSDGGSVAAALHLLHWNAPAAPPVHPPHARRGSPAVSPAVLRPAATIHADVRGVTLASIMRMVTPRQFWNLGFDTAADGNADVDWTGDGEDLTASAKVRLVAPAKIAAGRAPLNGAVDATYFERDGTVRIRQLDAATPASQAHVTGTLAVYPVTAPSSLLVQLTTHRLEEFNATLTDLGLAIGGRTGVAAIPVELSGPAEFNGTVGASLLDPDIRGHLTVQDFSTVFPTEELQPQGVRLASSSSGNSVQTTHWDSLDATGEYSSDQISIQHAVLAGHGGSIEFQGRLQAHRISARKQAFDRFSPLELTASLHEASLTDLLTAAGRSMPVSGTVDLTAHIGGSLDDLTGGAHVVVRDGAIEDEPYRSAQADLAFAGHRVDLSNFTLLAASGSAKASGNYDLSQKTFLLNLDGSNVELARIRRLGQAGIPLTGSLDFNVLASGTFEAPAVQFALHLAGATVEGQPVGGLQASGHTQNGILFFTGQSVLNTTRLDVNGQAALRGSYPLQAKFILTGLDIAPFLQMAKIQNVTGHSLISGSAEVSGPAKDPRHWNGSADIEQFSATLDNVAIASQGPLLASIEDGAVHIIQAHIVGPDTNLTLNGSIDPFERRQISLTAGGSVNMRLAETFDSDLVSSGRIDFRLQASGRLQQPQFTGQVQLVDVALALNDIPTGVSQLNGSMVFDQNRLEVQNITGSTGGGQLTLGGFIAYQNGVYGNITATGHEIRVRYSGVSATADTTLRLQGSAKNMLLSGNIQITRFMIGPTFDFAVLTRSLVPAPPPSPDEPANRVRLEVHVTSSPQLDFQNSYARLAGSLDLRIRGTVAQPSLLGQINIIDGTAKFAGTSYQLQHGRVYFSNPVRIDPVIDIDATTRIEEYDVTIGMHGTASHLTPTFRSDPPLPQADVISLLALGRTEQEQAVYSQQGEQAGSNPTTNALLGGALSAAVGSRVQRLFGVGSVKIDPTYVGNLGNSTARITVQQNISRDVQLTYATNVNTTAEQLIQAQVNLTENVSVLAVRDEAGVFSMVLQVHKRAR